MIGGPSRCTPDGIRTHATAVRGRRPRPLDDGGLALSSASTGRCRCREEPPPIQRSVGVRCTPDGIRTHATAVRGRRPRPLDDGGLALSSASTGRCRSREEHPPIQRSVGVRCTPDGIRTHATAVRGRRPRPLDDGGLELSSASTGRCRCREEHPPILRSVGVRCTPDGIRTHATAVRGRRPRPLDDGGLELLLCRSPEEAQPA